MRRKLTPEIMKARSNNEPTRPISLSDDFFLLASGGSTINDVIAERHRARAEAMAREDDYTRRRRDQRERSDPFSMSYCR